MVKKNLPFYDENKKHRVLWSQAKIFYNRTNMGAKY